MEGQLLKPYHQNILDLADGNAESLQSVIVNLAAVSSKEGFDIDKLYAKAVESGDASIQTNFFFLMEMFSTKGVKGMMKIVASGSNEGMK